jgi:hypothetical protein
LYGLKQSGLAWSDELTSTLVKQGCLTQSTGDACFFYNDGKEDGKKYFIFLVKHVDDILISTNDSVLYDTVAAAISKYGNLNCEFNKFTYLGMQLEQQSDRSVH